MILSRLRGLFRRPGPPAPDSPAEREEDLAERRARQQRLSEIGTELLERRVELDGRRGPLAGDMAVSDALEALEERFRRGEIGEAEFEAEKVRLLTEG